MINPLRRACALRYSSQPPALLPLSKVALKTWQFFGQAGNSGKLNEDVNIDPLFGSIQFSDITDLVLLKELLTRLDTIVSSFNREEDAYTP